jgi:hypothetical protein
MRGVGEIVPIVWSLPVWSCQPAMLLEEFDTRKITAQLLKSRRRQKLGEVEPRKRAVSPELVDLETSHQVVVKKLACFGYYTSS